MGRKRLIAPKDADQITARLPEGMREHLNRLADESGRSTNSEVVFQLQRALSPTDNPEAVAMRAYVQKGFDEIKAQLARLEALIERIK